MSLSKQLDGLWIGVSADDAERILWRVEAALCLTKTHDQLRYNRLVRDLERVWVRLLPDGLGSFNELLAACELDARFVGGETSSLEVIAAAIVHEATHARLMRRGIDYQEGLRARVEAICLRREKAFAAKLPNGEEVRERAERTLQLCATQDYWTDVAFNERYLAGAMGALKHLGVPDWIGRTLLTLRAARVSVARRLHGRARPSTNVASQRQD
jgi:hypothetical protein